MEEESPASQVLCLVSIPRSLSVWIQMDGKVYVSALNLSQHLDLFHFNILAVLKYNVNIYNIPRVISASLCISSYANFSRYSLFVRKLLGSSAVSFFWCSYIHLESIFWWKRIESNSPNTTETYRECFNSLLCLLQFNKFSTLQIEMSIYYHFASFFWLRFFAGLCRQYRLCQRTGVITNHCVHHKGHTYPSARQPFALQIM